MKNLITYFIAVFLLLNLKVTSQTWSPVANGVTGGNPSSVYSLLNDTINNLLCVGGGYTVANGISANHIAQWNGSAWNPLGSGTVWVNGGNVFAQTLYNGDLYVGGNFITAGGITANGVAKWDGVSWSNLGSGIAISSLLYKVACLAVYNGELYAGGNFDNAGGSTVNRIAKWDGTTWSPVGTGVSGGSSVGVFSFAVYNGELYAGGTFTNAGGIPANGIAKWNGTTWSAVGTGVNAGVYTLLVHNNELYAGGNFTTAGGTTANRVAKWNGLTWSPLGVGTGGSQVTSLASFNGSLYVGGIFTTAGGSSANKIAKWDGLAWSPVGTGMSGGTTTPIVNSLAVYNGELYAGGTFTNAGGIPVNNIAKLAGTSTGVNNDVFTILKLNIYPNPSGGEVRINSNGFIEDLKIVNVIGEIVHQSKPNQSQIDLKIIESGFYTVEITINGQTSTSRLIITK